MYLSYFGILLSGFVFNSFFCSLFTVHSYALFDNKNIEKHRRRVKNTVPDVLLPKSSHYVSPKSFTNVRFAEDFVQKTLDKDFADTSVLLSGATYCDKNIYKTMKFTGLARGFEVEDVLYDKSTDLQGFTGVMHSQKTVYVAFRGSSSLLNWIDDAEVIKTAYDTYPECGCKVHTGFYKANNGLKSKTIAAIKRILQKTGYNNVVVTGHSLGAAVAQLISMELRYASIFNTVYNFGQPRIGDDKYARYVNTIGQTVWRFTHNKDPVPHLPPEAMDYKHSCIEIFENEYGELYECNNHDCEDKNCADQYSFARKNASDHNIYLGYSLDCLQSIS